MSEKKYHVGLGVFGIYAGTLKNKEEWQGKKYVMRVEEYQEDTDE